MRASWERGWSLVTYILSFSGSVASYCHPAELSQSMTSNPAPDEPFLTHDFFKISDAFSRAPLAATNAEQWTVQANNVSSWSSSQRQSWNFGNGWAHLKWNCFILWRAWMCSLNVMAVCKIVAKGGRSESPENTDYECVSSFIALIRIWWNVLCLTEAWVDRLKIWPTSFFFLFTHTGENCSKLQRREVNAPAGIVKVLLNI